MRLISWCLATLLAATSSAEACEMDSGAVQLPNETTKDFEYRAGEVLSARFAELAIKREEWAYRNAPVAYFAMVKSSANPLESKSGFYEAEVQPKKSLKGTIPTENRKLLNPNTGGLCEDEGDGGGASGRTGSLVLVFEGLPKSESRPNGIDSFEARQVRSRTLLDAIAKYMGYDSE